MSAGPANYRYPGPHFFRDHGLDRLLFCGRTSEATRLLQLVLAEDLVVIYAKSGTGKTSLINATLLEPLRGKHFLPVVARVNDLKVRPSASVFEAVRRQAAAEDLELVDGDPSSLLRYFQTVEIWREDVLITPVVILDQFEELFTIQPPEARRAFVHELAVAHGRDIDVRHTGSSVHDPSEDGRAPLKLVISIREDSLGELEELALNIPDILRNRFRLGPLSDAEAQDAIVKPAGVVDGRLATPPFEWDAATVTRLITFLHQRRVAGRVDVAPHLEPFQLQLICQHVERLVRDRAAARQPLAPIDYEKDIGGDTGARRIVRGFYEDQIESLATAHPRRRLRRLCEHGLITARGRRAMLDEQTILKDFKLAKAALDALVERHVLRAEPRGDEVRYEISHDTLLEPIVEARTERRDTRTKRVVAAVVTVLLVAGVTAGVLAQSDWYLHWRTRQEGAEFVNRLRGEKDSSVLSWAIALAWADQPVMAKQAVESIEERSIRAAGFLQMPGAFDAIDSDEGEPLIDSLFKSAMAIAQRVPSATDRVLLVIQIGSEAERLGRAEAATAAWNALPKMSATQPDAALLVAELLRNAGALSEKTSLSALRPQLARDIGANVLEMLTDPPADPDSTETRSPDKLAAAGDALLGALPAHDELAGQLVSALSLAPAKVRMPQERVIVAARVAATLAAHGRRADAARVLERALPDLAALDVNDRVETLAGFVWQFHMIGNAPAARQNAQALLRLVESSREVRAGTIAAAVSTLSPSKPDEPVDSELQAVVERLSRHALKLAGNEPSFDVVGTYSSLSRVSGTRVPRTLWLALAEKPDVDKTEVAAGLWMAGYRDEALALAKRLNPGQSAIALLRLAHLSEPSGRQALVEEVIAMARTLDSPLDRGGLLADGVAWYVHEKKWSEALALVVSEPDAKARQEMTVELLPGVRDETSARDVMAFVAGLPRLSPLPGTAQAQAAGGAAPDAVDFATRESVLRLTLLEAALRVRVLKGFDDAVRQDLVSTTEMARSLEAVSRQEWLVRLAKLAARHGDVPLARQLAAEVVDEGERLEIYASVMRASAARQNPELMERIYKNEPNILPKAGGRW